MAPSSTSPHRFLLILILGISTVTSFSASADVTNLNGKTPVLRLRAGSNSNSVDTVTFDVPGLQLGDGSTVYSTNNIPGGTGVYTVRYVMDTRYYPATGRFYADSSSPMACVTPSTCGTASIPFNTISWSIRDGDMMDLASQFNTSSNQLLHQQSNPLLQGRRYRDYVRFGYANNLFVPAGTYQGQVVFSGEFQ